MAGGPESSSRPLVVACGLGPAGAEFLNEAVRTEMAHGRAFVRTARHLAAEPFVAAGAEPLDECYTEAGTFEEAYRAIVERLVAAAEESGRVSYGVPGSPYV